MGLNRLAIAIVYARDYQLLKDWYGKSLGLEVAEADDEAQWAEFAFPGGEARFAVHGGVADLGKGRNRIQPMVEVTDIRATLEELKERGVEVDSELRDSVPGLLMAGIRDPEDNSITLFETLHG